MTPLRKFIFLCILDIAYCYTRHVPGRVIPVKVGSFETEVPWTTTIFLTMITAHALYVITSPLIARALQPLLATRVVQATQARLHVVFAPLRTLSHPLATWLCRPAPPPADLEYLLACIMILWGCAVGYNLATLLTPLALLALLVRKIRSCYCWIQTFPRSPPATSPFRLLGLPPELRTRVYKYASKTAWETSASITQTGSKSWKFNLERRTPQEMIGDLLALDEKKALKSSSSNRLAILLTNRQIYCEASSIYYSAMRIDIKLCYLRSSIPPITAFMDIFKTKLRFVRSLEIELSTAEIMLFVCSPKKTTNQLSSLRFQDLEKTKKLLLNMRGCLVNVETVTVYPDHKGETLLEDFWDLTDRQAVGFNITYQLAHCPARWCLEGCFPRLKDIITTNRFGSERFSRTDSGRWELWYAKRPIPGDRRPRGQVLLLPDMVYDTKTRLSSSTSLMWMSL